MSKKLLWLASSIIGFLAISGSVEAQTEINLFDLPDSICNGTYIAPTNVIDSAKSYSWSFCAPDLYAAPDGANTGTMASIHNPSQMLLLRQNNVSFTYHINDNGDLIRSRYLNGLEGLPSLITTAGHVDNPLGLYAIEDDNNIYHIFVISGTDAGSSKITRFDFANGIQTMPSKTVTLGTFPLLNKPKQLFIAKDNGKWFGFTFTQKDSLVKLSFGTNLLDTPTVTLLGNIDKKFSGVSGLTGIVELGDWHLFVTNRKTSTIDRISFGDNLDNIPFVINLGDFNNSIKRPVGIAITKGCESYYAYVLNYGTNGFVTLKWDAQSIANQPVYINHGLIAGANVVQPTSLSGILDENGTLFMFGLNIDNSISKLMFHPCTNSSIAHSDQRYPPVFTYDEPGVYTVFLTINQGLPDVQTACKTIIVFSHPTITTSNDTLICEGDKIKLSSLSLGSDSILWAPDYRIDTLRGHFVHVDPHYSIKYVATTYFGPHCIVPDTINITVSKIIADAGPDRIVKDGATTVLGGPNTTVGPQYTYLWTPDIGITESTGTPITEARPPYDITYYLHVSDTNGCKAVDTVNVRVPCDDIHLPNAFVPGSHNSKVNKFGLLNQQFIKINYFKIFDRWGQEVFSTTDPQGKWDGTVDGKDAPMGVYVWEVDANCANTQLRYRRTGTVTLIR